jgi:hypothetical protein
MSFLMRGASALTSKLNAWLEYRLEIAVSLTANTINP